MPVEVLADLLADKDIDRNLQFQLIIQCAPLIKGLKVASVMSMDLQNSRYVRAIIKDTGIECKFLAAYKKERVLVIFYRRKELEAHLFKPEVRRFLEDYGYEYLSLNRILNQLMKRAVEYSYDGATFPHEIGAFLDYPIDDVKAFIEKKGEESLMIGYWKVYYEPEKARRIFRAYDDARKQAVQEFLEGKHFRDIVCQAA